MPRLAGLMVVGTDTEVGKTLVAGAIARHLRRMGRKVAVFKPAATGCRRDRGQLVSADAEFLAACADSTQNLSEIAPVRYSAALAPNVAAGIEGRAVDLEAIFDAYRGLSDHGELVVVEGIGGLLCPITDDFWVVHFAKMIDLPVIIVARAGLGTINQTLLTLHAARVAGLKIAGVVVNRYPVGATADEAATTNPAQIAQRGKTELLAMVPDEEANSVEDATIGPDTAFTIGQVEWERIARGGS